MDNPFVYGREVEGSAFFNRVQELAELSQDIKNGVHLLIYSPRRYGKTSLVRKLLAHAAKEGMITCYCNCYPVIEESDFISLYASAVSKSIREPLKKGLEIVRTLFTSLSPAVTIGDDGAPTFSIEPKGGRQREVLLAELLEALPRYAKKKKTRAIVAFDEFQQIGELPSDRLEKTLRTAFESHSNTTYIFLGSRKHLLHEMFQHPKRPFYRSVKHYPLNKIAAQDFAAFIRKGFNGAKLSIDEAPIYYLISLVEEHPFYVQYLAHEVWDAARVKRGVVDRALIEGCLDAMMKRETSAFQNMLDLLTLKQREALRAISLIEKDEQPFSQSFLSRHRLGSAASFRKSLVALVERDLVEKTENGYVVQDFLLKHFMRIN